MVQAAPLEEGVIAFDGPARIRPIVNDESLNRHMEVLRRAAYEAGVIKAKLDADKTALERQARNTRLRILDATGSPVVVPLGKYLRDLCKEIDAYARSMDSETVENGDGRVARRRSPDSLNFMSASEEDDGPATAKHGERLSLKRVTEKVGAALNKVLSALKLDRFWKVEIKPDLTAAKKSLEQGKCTAEELAEQGMVLVPGLQRIDIGTANFKSEELAKLRSFFE